MDSNKQISIPYGAIKSSPPSKPITPVNAISIPYGAIKRNVEYNTNIISIEFQFLMVRLKDCYKNHLIKIYEISIPYGAIKSYEVVVDENGTITFQFLMVRLKVN